MRRLLPAVLLVSLPLLAAPPVVPGPLPTGEIQLPNGRLLTPTGTQTEVLSYPFGLAMAAGGARVVAASTGAAAQALQLLDAATGRLLFTLPVDRSWLGLAVSPDGSRVYLAGANRNAVLVTRLKDDRLQPDGEIPVRLGTDGKRDPLPGGLGLSPDGRTLWVARVLADDLLEVDVASRSVRRAVPVGRAPYRPVVSPDGRLVAVARWGAASVALVDAGKGAVLGTVDTADHPCDLAFSPDGSRLYVAQANRNLVGVVDVASRKVLRQVSVAMGPDGPGTPSAETMPDGSTPNALALSPDGRTLYVANADDDAIAVVDVGGEVAAARTRGFVPSGWYPASLALSPDGKTLFAGNGKGGGSTANATNGPDPTVPERRHAPGLTKTLPGSVSRIPVPDPAELEKLTRRAYANRKPGARGAAVRPSLVVPARPGAPSPIRNVIYIIRENRTYDQVLGDLGRGNGDPKLAIFPRSVTPNAHALADEFVLFDNFYADAEVSADGHNWSMAAYATDYTEKTWVATYASRGFSYVYEGGDPIAAPTAGYLWDAAVRRGLSVRNYGEFVGLSAEAPGGPFKGTFEGTVENLRGNTCPFYPGFDTDVLDVARVDLWLKEFRGFVKKGEMPRLSILRLGNDHTLGTRSKARTPRAMVADNDLALGRLVEEVSRSRFWKETAIFVVEDDAQNGSDHVDCHRTIAFVVSPYTRRGGMVDSTLYSTTSMLRTMELILGLPPMSQHDAAATPMTEAFADHPDPTPFVHRPITVDLYETNRDGAPMQAESDGWDFTREDATPEIALNEAIWKSVRGADSPMPAPVNAAWVRVRPGD